MSIKNGVEKFSKNIIMAITLKLKLKVVRVLLFYLLRLNFVCLPDFGAGCHLNEFNDEFYNTQKLSNVINPADGITVAKGLKTFVKRQKSSLKSKKGEKNHD